jgi:hypothetical protein
MLKTLLISSVALVVLVILPTMCSTGIGYRGVEAAPVQTGTAVDSIPCTQEACDSYVHAAVDQHWKTAAAVVGASLVECRAFTSAERDRLTAREEGLSEREKYFLRLSILKQLAQKTTT